MRQEPEILLAVAEARITWVLNHPAMSDWLKQALKSADGIDPVRLQNDVFMLGQLIEARAKAQIELALR
ncbi:MAG: hypothetical protein B7Y47_13015 [Sphingomonas sp. 28-63-12]|nr:MAG: hypothetical protein B7Y47_13015 [Sphingomonas sp. 28-63-12]